MSSAIQSHIINTLGFHLLKSSEKGHSVCISSLAILENLNTVLKFTTSDKIVKEIDDLLEFNAETKRKTREEKIKILSDLISSIIHGDTEFVTITLGNGVCLPVSFNLENTSVCKDITLCKDDASIKKLNENIVKLTENKIKNFLNDHNKPKSGITLFNVMHLQAAFCNVFRPDSTEIGEFHTSPSKTIKLPMLKSGGMIMYNDDKEVGVRVMYHSFNGCNYSVLVLVPIKKFGLDEMEKKLTAEKYDHLLTNMRSVLGSLTIPKLTLNNVSDLTSTFKKCGLTDLFDASNASLTKITNSKVAVDHIVEGTSISLNEFGSNKPKRELMQSEMYGMCCGAFTSPPEEQNIIANEPFLLIINFHKGNAIISINRVVEPIATE